MPPGAAWDLHARSLGPGLSTTSSPFRQGGSRRGRRLGGGTSSTLGGRCASAPQLDAKSSGALPSIGAEKSSGQPLSFDELYTFAKRRIAKKNADSRAGGTSPHCRPKGLPQLFSTSSGSGSRRPPRGSLQPLADNSIDELAVLAAAEENAWARSTLAAIPVAPDTSVDIDAEEARMAAALVEASPLLTGPQSPTEAGASPMAEGLGNVKRTQSQAALVADVAGAWSPETGFSAAALARVTLAFNRFKVPGEADLHCNELAECLRYLSHVVSDARVAEIAKEVTIYDYMDFDEFISFYEKYLTWEREQWQLVFNEQDDDGSGELSVDELRRFMSQLGFVPLREGIHEALAIVDEDGTGQLNFEELATFLAVYMRNEGFSLSEVKELTRTFNRVAQDEGDGRGLLLAPDRLSDALIANFGLQGADFALAVGAQLASGQGMSKSSMSSNPGGEPEKVNFREFLIVSRKLRENLRDQTRAHFETARAMKQKDEEGEGVSEAMIKKFLKSKGYTPLKQVMNEIFPDVLDDGLPEEDRELDFDEFFNFMLVFMYREGFVKAAMDEMTKIFRRFDDDDSGEISSLELSEMLRHLGYANTQEEIRDYVQQVDKNGSGALDVREFLRLMRLFREGEMTKIRAVFDSNSGQKPRLPNSALGAALAQLGHANHSKESSPMEKLLGKKRKDAASAEDTPVSEHTGANAPSEGHDFDSFVAVVDSCRNAYVAKQRKKCGFTDKEIAEFQEQFNQFDKDSSGDIDVQELQKILKKYKWEPKTKEEQADLMKKIDESRELALEAGITDVSPAGSQNIRFWVFVRLCRTLRTEFEKLEEKRMAALRLELKFNDMEMEQFRHVFRNCVKQQRQMEASAAGVGQPKPAGGDAEELNGSGIRRLIRSLGVSITPQNSGKLDERLASLDEHGRKEGAMIDFTNFLRLMRWFLDTDFAGINRAAEATGAKQVESVI